MLDRRLPAAVLLTLVLAAPALAQDPGLPAPKKSGAFPAKVTTGFDPRRDGSPFPNVGDYASQGNCIGMALLAVDSYKKRLARESAGEVSPPPPPLPKSPATADLVAEETAALAQDQQMKNLDSGKDHVNDEKRLSDPKALRAALERIQRSGVPEIMTLDSSNDGHATVLFGYKNGKLQIYDPNFPGETVQWPFDPVHGLGRHPKASDDPGFYGKLRRVGSTPFSQFQTGRDLAWIRASCSALDGSCKGRFETVTAKIEPSSHDHVLVSGKISGGLKRTIEHTKPERTTHVWVAVNGKAVARARVAKDGTYKVTVPAAVLGGDSNDVRVVALTNHDALAGYSEQQVPRFGVPASKGLVEALPAH